MLKNIVVIGGKPRSGKNEFASGLEACGVTTVTLSDILINMIAGKLDMPAAVIKENKVAWRGMLQWFGEDYYGGYHKDPAGLIRRAIANNVKEDTLAIIGVRRPKELSWLINYCEANSVKLRRIYIFNPFIESSDSHPIENSLSADDFQFTVINNSTIQALHNHAKRLAERLYEKRDRQT